EATWQFLIDYNEQRPHDALGGMTPAEYRDQYAKSSTSEMSA
ncbi:transposase, partial [Dyella jejuensis]